MPRPTSRTVFALAIALVLWASAFAGIRAGLVAYSPAHLAILRFVTASIFLVVYAGIAHFRRPQFHDLPGLSVTGLLGITIYNLALNYGETRVTAGAASLLIASVPIWTALFARFWLHERLTSAGWCGVLVSFIGVALIASGEGEGIRISPQALIILAAALASAIYMILQKKYLARYTALEFTAYSIWIGTLLMLPFANGLVSSVMSAPLRATLSVIYLGVFPGALAYVAWAQVLTEGSAGRTATLLYVIPVMAVAIAWLWLGEVPHWISLVGGAVALAGVILVNTTGGVASARQAAEPVSAD